jgi:hypothetical protein
VGRWFRRWSDGRNPQACRASALTRRSGRGGAVGAYACSSAGGRDLALDLLTTDADTGEVTVRSAGRKVVMNVHITDTTLTGDNPVGRWGDKPVTTAQI